MSEARSGPAVAADLAGSVFPDPHGDEPVRAELYGSERLEAHAHHLAAQADVSASVRGRALLPRLRRCAHELTRARQLLADAARNKEPLGPDADWLLDNFHIIADTLREVNTDLPGGYYRLLPRLASGPLSGFPRVWAAALELIAHSDSSLDEANITHFVQAYQAVRPLTIGELWAVPSMLRLVLLENLRRLARQILEVREARRRAQQDANRAATDPRGARALSPPPAPPRTPAGDAYLAELLELLREQGPSAVAVLEELERHLSAGGDPAAAVLARERQRQASNQVSIGNCVTSLRLLSALDWPVFFERTSHVEAVLRQCPTGVYALQDFPTRDRCRRVVEQLARRSNTDELEVARLVLARANEHHGLVTAGTTPPRDTVAWYLLDDGLREVQAELGYRAPPSEWVSDFVLRHPRLVYFGSLCLLTALLASGVLALCLVAIASAGLTALAVLLSLLPASELAVGVVNALAVRLVKPRSLAKLSFEQGVPDDCVTFVVMPTMLVRPDSARVLLDRLEIHYLSNPDPNLYFALLTDFADAPAEHMPEDDAYLQAALEGVRQLNARYAKAGQDRFFVLHRKRQHNPSQNVWMGWERKRGKLTELNRLLRGDKATSYTTQSGDVSRLPRIRYVITLDADTQMPHETARRLVATLAHPLNGARFDAEQGRVVAGYGVLQPRISLSLPGSRKTLFARIWSGSAGIDPYTTAVSDVYQDLFGVGSFTGKGIYDVDAFEAATGQAFPENRILSHDLIEGNFARCGLVTDVELLDELPARWHVWARRDHRWARGDWQILSWLFPRAPSAHGRRKNPLPLVERWKIFDNLRRSLVPPALMLTALCGWAMLPGPAWFWTVLVLAVVGVPLWLQVCAVPFRMVYDWARGRRWQGPPDNLGNTTAQALLSVVFLADQARLMLDAAGRTLFRLCFTRRRLLEWETAASTDRRLGDDLASYCVHAWFGPVVALVTGIGLAFGRPDVLPGALPLLFAWLLSPLVAWWVSRPIKAAEPVLTEDERRRLRLIARKTWCFFETFVGDEDHWLPPDNFQEDPKGEVAHRTSPTNIGLHLLSSLAAHDLGYATLPHLLDRLERSFATLDRLERHRGHFFNWYDTRTLKPLAPRYVSTVDSGNLAACLIALRQGLAQKIKETVTPTAALAGLTDTCDLAADAFRRAVHGLPTPLPPHAAVIDKHLHELERLLDEPPADLPGLDDRLARLEAPASALASGVQALAELLPEGASELRRWAWHLLHQVRDRHAELHALAPWLDLLREAPAPFRPLVDAGSPPELTQRWEEVYARLARPAGPATVAAGAEALAAEVLGLEAHLPPGRALEGASGWLGRLAAAVMTSVAADWQRRATDLADHAVTLASAMDFRLLYNRARHLFAVGLDLAHGRLDGAHYDLLASEACLTSFLAVARGDVPRKHWFQLGRPLTRVHGEPALLSWGGTLFEYLMPRLLLRPYRQTLLDTSREGAVERQRDYGRQARVPWGISESAFNALDGARNYQYQAFGVPGLGLKRGLSHDLVVAPYATALALAEAPRAALDNFRRLAQEGAEGAYGYYESIDFTPERVPPRKRSQVVRCFMAHHQGMTLTALANCLLGDIFPRRFHAEPMVRATELLLQERLPQEVPPVQLPADDLAPPGGAETGTSHVSRRLTTPHTAHPRTHLISNGNYTVILTASGAGRSLCQGLDVTRWREDATRDCWGQFIYIRDLRTGKLWSATYQPLGREPDEQEVVFASDKAEFRRRDGDIETHLEITISPERCAEVRRVVLTNFSTRPRDIEVTSYLEPVLAPHGADLAHPAFGKLFLETEWVASHEALLCRRRPRSADQKPLWCVHVVAVEGVTVGSAQYETDRARFLGRGGAPAFPAALASGTALSATTGPVLDPVLSLRHTVRLPAGSTVSLAFTTAMASTRDEALALADHYHDFHGVTRAFEMAWAHVQMELRHLRLSPGEAHLYQRLAGHVIQCGPALRGAPALLAANRQGQPGLWRYGISGDRPIVLVRVAEQEEMPLVRQALAAHAFWRLKGLECDLVILNCHPAGYFEDLQQEVLAAVRAGDDRDVLDKPGGVFVRKAPLMPEEDQVLLEAAARCVLVGSRGTLAEQLDRLERTTPAPAGRPRRRRRKDEPAPPQATLPAGLLFVNGRGGFTADGREYVIKASVRGDRAELPPAPWINVIANPVCGFLISESGGGYTWVGNSQTNRLTPWANDPVSDPPGEALYLRDRDTGLVWSPTPLPAGEGDFLVRHGQGYTVFTHTSHGLEHELTLFVPPGDAVKIIHLRVRNVGFRRLRLSATFYAEWVLGTVRDQAPQNVVTEVDATSGVLLARNAFNAEFGNRLAFADVSLRPRTFSADRTAFLGRNGSTAAPSALENEGLDGIVGAPLDPCAALQAGFEVPPGQAREVVFLLGEAGSVEEVRQRAARYRDPAAARAALRAVREQWDRALGAIEVRTPDPAFDLLVNRWLPYQVLSCRVWGRSALYQSSGAYGFRDQLQDVMALVYGAPDQTRAHLLRAGGRQFPEGDVQHWWHPPGGGGIRTRFSDDFLWLPLAVAHYVQKTGDTGVLDEPLPFLRAPALRPDQEEDYRRPDVSPETATLFEHCARALEHGCTRGAHGLPLMGAGDWNDGMNKVGIAGKGESTWDGWFLVALLPRWADLATAHGEHERAARWREQAELYRQALEEHAWDGNWYTRAWFDDGTPLGTHDRTECRIDSLPQTWAVISGKAQPERARQAMAAVYEHLVRRDDRLILLFTPSFDKSDPSPGYIQGYVPGIRENGGQYTHGSTWVVEAFALLGDGTRAMELFDLLSPIRRTDQPEGVERYRVEPYVLPGDVYGEAHAGRGGWSWYTGSASWLYRIAVETLLGLHVQGDRLALSPCVPATWKEFSLTYRRGRTTWALTVENPEGVERGVTEVTVDGQLVADGMVALTDDGGRHEVRVRMGQR